MSQVRRQKRDYARGLLKSIHNTDHQRVMSRYFAMLEKYSAMEESSLSQLIKEVYNGKVKGLSATDRKALADANIYFLKKKMEAHMKEKEANTNIKDIDYEEVNNTTNAREVDASNESSNESTTS